MNGEDKQYLTVFKVRTDNISVLYFFQRFILGTLVSFPGQIVNLICCNGEVKKYLKYVLTGVRLFKMAMTFGVVFSKPRDVRSMSFSGEVAFSTEFE